MSYQVVGYPLCPFVQRVLITLNEKGVDYELIWLDPHAELPTWFKEWSPLGKVPVMKVPTGEVLFESMAIVEYIEEENPEPSIFAASTVERAFNRAWAGVAGDLYGPQYMSMRAKTNEEVANYFNALKETLQVLEGECGDAFFAGDKLTAVDVVLAPMFARFALVASLGAENVLDTFPKLSKLSDKLLTLPAVEKTIEGDWRDNFINNMKKNEGILFK